MEVLLSAFHLIKKGISEFIKNQLYLIDIPITNDAKFGLIFENGEAGKYQQIFITFSSEKIASYKIVTDTIIIKNM